MNPKIARDPYLRAVAERWGEQAAFDAGFFLDDDPFDAPLDDVDWLCTPTSHLEPALTAGDPAGRRPVVLLATGAFFPLHAGHLAMMQAATERAEAAGWWVVGAYLSPGHDDYLRLKWGATVPPASPRIAALTEQLAARGTAGDYAQPGQAALAVDPWEALHRRVSVNYTDVTARLQRYLRAHLRSDIDVAFVCGADNARFALAFALEGRCIVVGRPGRQPEFERWRADPRTRCERILWADLEHPEASSDLSPDVPAKATSRLHLRLEDADAVRTLGLGPDRWRRFQQRLVEELAARVDGTPVPIADQRGAPTDRVISLDPLLPGEADLAVSRLFDLGGYRLLGHVARPGHPPLPEQVTSIPAGTWRLRDDDRSSGATLAFVERLLAPAIKVSSTVVALADPPGDIADSRDFLIGSDDGGLVVALPGGAVGRAPYLLPYVDPAVRCCVPPTEVVAFSIAVWLAGADAFADSGLSISHLPAPSAVVFAAAGHGPATPLDQLCRWHAERLAGLLQVARSLE